MTADDIYEKIQSELKGLATYFVTEDYENSVSDALLETGWALPTSVSFQLYWIKTRAKRHMFFMLLSESAHKFKYEQINLQHRFDHYYKLITTMDDQFKEVMEEHPDEFLEALGLTNIVSGLFGTKVDAGFRYNAAGEDITYSDSFSPIFSPKASDK